MPNATPAASPPAKTTSTDETAQRKLRNKGTAQRAARCAKRNADNDAESKPSANGLRLAPFVREALEDRHGALPRGAKGEWTHAFECKSVVHGCGFSVNTDEGPRSSLSVSAFARIGDAAEFVRNERPLRELGRLRTGAERSDVLSCEGPPIESEDGRGNMWYGYEQRNVIGYPVPKAGHVNGSIVHLDDGERLTESRKRGVFFYDAPPLACQPEDAGVQVCNMYWRQPLATRDPAYDSAGIGKLFYSADASLVKLGSDYSLDMTMMPMSYAHMGAWQLIDQYDTRPYAARDAEGACPMYGIGGPKELRAHTDEPFWFDRGIAPRADAGYAHVLHHRYNHTFQQFYGAQIGDWGPLLGTNALLFQERMLWIVDGAGAAGVVPHDLLWMLLPSYQPLMWLPDVDAIGMDTQLRREQMAFDPSSLAKGDNTCGPTTHVVRPQSDQKRAERQLLMGVKVRPVANPYRDLGQAAAVAAIAFPIARAQSLACTKGRTDEEWLRTFVEAAERYGLMRDAPKPQGIEYGVIVDNEPNPTGPAWRCAEQLRTDGVHPLLRRGADETARPLYAKHDYSGAFLMSYFPEATNIDLARLSPSFMFTMFGLRRPRVLSPNGVSPTHIHNLNRKGLFSPYAASRGSFWQLPVDATRCEGYNPRHVATLSDITYFPENWASGVGGPLWWELPHSCADAPIELFFPDGVPKWFGVLNQRCRDVVDGAYGLDQKTEHWFPFPRAHPQLYRDMFQTRPGARLRVALARKPDTASSTDVEMAYEALEMVYTSRETQAVRQHARGVDGWYSCFDTHRSVAHLQALSTWNATTGIEPGTFCTLSEKNALDGGASARGLLASLAHFHMATRVDPFHARGVAWSGTSAARLDASLIALAVSIWDRALVGSGYQLLAPGTAGGVALGEAEQAAHGGRSFSATHIAKWVPRQAPTLRRTLLRIPAVLRNAFGVPSLTRAPPPANRAAAMLRTDPINPPADEVWAELLRARALEKMPRSRVDEDTPEANAALLRLQEADLLGGLNRGMPMAVFRIGLVALPDWIKLRRRNEFPLHTFASPTRVDVVEPFAHFLEEAASLLSAECARDHMSWMTVRCTVGTSRLPRETLMSRSGELRELTEDARHVDQVARNLITGLAAEFGVVLAGVANELSPYAETRFSWRLGADKSAEGEARRKRMETLWNRVCMPFSVTHADPNVEISAAALAPNPFVISGAALVSLAVEREVDPAAYAACLELLQMGEAALGINGRSSDDGDPEVSWRAGKTFGSMKRGGGATHTNDTTTGSAMHGYQNACAALSRVRELLVPPVVLNDREWARRPAAQRNWCISASENVTVPCWPDFDLPLDNAGSRRATEDTRRYLILRRHLHSWLGEEARFNAEHHESSSLIFSGLHRELTKKIPDLHVDMEPGWRRHLAAYAVLHDCGEPKNTDRARTYKRYRVQLPDHAERWWMQNADQARARHSDKEMGSPYRNTLHGPIATAEVRADREQAKRKRGVLLEPTPYREAFRARLQDIAEAAVRVAAAVVLQRNVGELRWYVGSVTVLEEGRLPRQRIRRRNRWVAVTDEEEAAMAAAEAAEASNTQQPDTVYGPHFRSDGGIGTGNAGDGPLPAGSASEEARRTRLAVLRVCERRRRAQRVLHTRTILKPQLHEALLNRKHGLLTRLKERRLTAGHKVALHAEMSGRAGMQAAEDGDAEARLREGIRRRRELAEMR